MRAPSSAGTALPRRWACNICVETKDAGAFPRSPITRASVHTPGTCLKCIEISISSDINTKSWKDIRCPDCSASLAYEDVQRYANSETARRYADLSARYAAQQDENFVWCASGCGGGQLHQGGLDQPIAKCHTCGSLTCFQHNVAWHTSLTCDQYDEMQASSDDRRLRLEREAEERRAQENEASKEKIKQTTKKCPGCQSPIEKNGGCAHITCFICRREFCWGCNATWSYSHSCRGPQS